MTLITCPECSGPVSTRAGTCPHCGAPVPAAARGGVAGAVPGQDADAVIWEGGPRHLGTMVWAWLCCLTIALLPVGLVLMLVAHLRTRGTRYTLTARRLALRRGLLATSVDEISLFRIKDIELRRSFWQRLGGIGTILVTSLDTVEPVAELRAVRDPEGVRRTLRAQVDAARLAEGVRTVLD